MIKLDVDKAVHTGFAPASELEKQSLHVIALAGRGHKELKIIFKK